MPPIIHRGHRVLLRDLILFQIKLIVDAIKDILLIKLSILAALIDFFFGRRGRPLLFYRVLSMSERFDLWLNIYAPARAAEQNEEGLFGVSEAGDRSLLGTLEVLSQEKARGFRKPAAG